MARHLASRRSRRRGLQPHRREGAGLGGAQRQSGRADAARGGRRRRVRDDVRRQRRRRARGGATARTARWPGWTPGRSWSTTPPPRPTSPASSPRRAPRRCRLRRRPGVGRPGRRRERTAHGDVRCRRRGVFDRARAGDRRLRPGRASGWARPGAGQLTKMVNQICIAGIVQGLAEGSTSPSVPVSTSMRGRRGDRQGRGAELADGQPGAPMARASSTSASPSSGCARTSASSSTRRTATAPACR
jgi:hypothetical protein